MLLGVPWEPQWSPCGVPAVCLGASAALLPSGLGALDAIWAEPAPLVRFSGVVWGAPDTIWAEPVVGLGRRGGSGERGWDVSGG